MDNEHRSLELSLVSVGDASQRTRNSSFNAVPQHLRGITLFELREFYDTNREWLETYQWRCNSCHRRCPQQSGPCPTCSYADGVKQTPNLYEVSEEMIKPLCESVSYVEMLSRNRQGERFIPPVTFVSHWWGAEFQKLMFSLERYAAVRCRKLGGSRLAKAVYFFTYLFSSLCTTGILAVLYEPSELKGVRRDTILMPCLALACLLVVILTTVSVEHREAYKGDPGKMAFWICAFCNNQFCVEHALAVDGDVYSSAFALALRADSCRNFICILDPNGEIYRRAWCIFELFFVQHVLPHNLDQHLEFAIVNEAGVISDGDASVETLKRMSYLIKHVHSASAQATKTEDLEMIQAALQTFGVSPCVLDDILIDSMEVGLRMATIRMRLVLVLFGFIPITAWFISILYNSLFLHYIIQLDYVPVMLPAKRLVLKGNWRKALEVSLLEHVGLCCVAVRLLMRKGARTCWIVSWRMFVIMLPPVVVQVLGEVFLSWDEYAANLKYIQMLHLWKVLSDLMTFWVACLGAASGMVFLCARNVPCFATVRQVVEDSLLA